MSAFHNVPPVNDTVHKVATTPLAPVSQSKVLHLPMIDKAEFQRWFAPKFAEFLRSRFTSPEVVAQVFQVRASTAWNWWNGDNRASGDAVMRTFMLFPDAVAWFLQEWEGR
jgi:hypothetical protein